MKGSIRWSRFWLLGVILVFGALHVAWILEDRAPMAQTDAYGLLTQNLRATHDQELTGPGELTYFVGNLSLQGRPPLYQLLSLPILRLGSWSENAAQFFNLGFLGLLVLSVYGATRLIADQPTALLAALLAATYPPIVHILHIYRPHAALPAWTALTLWWLLRFMQRPSIRRAWILCAILAAGAWLHPVYVFFVIFPVPFAALGGLYRQVLSEQGAEAPTENRSKAACFRAILGHRLLWQGLMPGAVFLVFVVSSWYLTVGRSLWSAHGTWTGESLAEYRGFEEIALGFPEAPAHWTWYLRTSIWALSWPLTVLAVLGILYLVKRPRWSHLLLLVFLVSGYVLQVKLDTAYAWWRIAPLLPIAAVASALWIQGLRATGLRRVVETSVAAVAVYVFLTVLWGPPFGSRAVAQFLGSPLESSTCETRARSAAGFCPAPPQADGWPVEQILTSVISQGSCAKGQPCVLTVLPSHGLSTALFRYHKWKRAPGVPLQILHLGSPAWGGGYRFEALLENDFLLYPPARLAGNRFLKATSAFLLEPSPLFRRSHRVARRFVVEGGGTLVLLQRVRPLSLAEAREVRAALQLPEKYLTTDKALLFRLRAVEQPRGVVEAYEQIDPEMPARERYATLIQAAVTVRDVSPEAALELLRKAAQVKPDATRPHVMQARIHWGQGRKPDALEAMRHASELDPTDKKIQRLLERMQGLASSP